MSNREEKIMPMWLCRAGRYGEFENKFLEDGKVYCTWDNLSESIMQFRLTAILCGQQPRRQGKNSDELGEPGMAVCP